jgi:hypothetical protein
VVQLVTDMIAVVLSRVAANKFSTMQHRPVITDILCILRHFVVPAGKIKFFPLPRSAISDYALCVSVLYLSLMIDTVLKHIERNRKITLLGRGENLILAARSKA